MNNYTGYTIPAGWVIMMVLPLVHFDADKYEDPLAFNPWRWKVICSLTNLIFIAT